MDNGRFGCLQEGKQSKRTYKWDMVVGCEWCEEATKKNDEITMVWRRMALHKWYRREIMIDFACFCACWRQENTQYKKYVEIYRKSMARSVLCNRTKQRAVCMPPGAENPYKQHCFEYFSSRRNGCCKYRPSRKGTRERPYEHPFPVLVWCLGRVCCLGFNVERQNVFS
jgi:hypothetical protein